MTPAKKKISYEQDMALHNGRQVARQNQKRAVAARQASERAAAEYAAADAKKQADDLAMRFGWALGETVTGVDRTWRKPRTGVVVEGPRSERGQGVFVLDADGNEWLLGRYSVKAV